MEVYGVCIPRLGHLGLFENKTDRKIVYGDIVVVESEVGTLIGKVLFGPLKDVQAKKAILKKATRKEIERDKVLREKEKRALKICEKKIKEENLPMVLVDSVYSLDRKRITFYFKSNTRVDFRNLLKQLAKVFKTRIELRQIGVRNEAKIIGGVGICGRPLCCTTFINDFEPISVKIAKAQNLPLNPAKISGLCGRLMCCLAFEKEEYLKKERES